MYSLERKKLTLPSIQVKYSLERQCVVIFSFSSVGQPRKSLTQLSQSLHEKQELGSKKTRVVIDVHVYN